jgi:putative peptidoglycan lipid II flippase
LSIIGTALGVAILPAISQAIARGNEDDASDVQARAFDLSMLLTLPATLALVVAAGPIIGALYQGGEYSVEDARVTGNILAILVTGLPAYVLVKVLTPAFYARKNVKTPVRIAMTVLGLGIVANFVLIPIIGIYSLATVTSVSAWINFALLFGILYAKGHFRMPAWLVLRISKQMIAALAMAAALYGIRILAGDMFLGGVVERVFALGALVGIGGAIYFAVAWMIGGMDREAIAALRRKKPVQ